MGEFELINRYFKRPARRALLGNGDDCALIAPDAGQALAVSSDMLVEGRHFLPDVSPEALGHKALAVNLSDLAAMGAEPLGFTLALALPRVDEAWLDGFSRGLLALADAHDCELLGGDTTRGPLTICITVFGQVPAGAALKRSGARVGDDIYVSGSGTGVDTECLGQASVALAMLQQRLPLHEPTLARWRERLERPQPRVALGLQLRGVASAAMDISDGLVGDLAHLLRASGVGATVDADAIATKLIANYAINTPANGQFDLKIAYQHALAGGDDYELLFTAPPGARSAVQGAAAASGCTATCVGQVQTTPGLHLVDREGRALAQTYASWDHFG